MKPYCVLPTWVLLLPGLLLAQDTAKLAHVVRASGEATVTAKPDRAEVSVAVTNQARKAEAASAQNAAQSTRVIAALKQSIGTSGDIKTTGYSIVPEYNNPTGGGSPTITGYRATNTVLVTVNDLSLLGKIVDAASGAGANDISGIVFTLRDDASVRAQALAQAAEKARANAEAIARALNLHVTGVFQAESSEAPIVRPLFAETKAMARMAAPTQTPIETGTIDIRASVVVTLQVQ